MRDATALQSFEETGREDAIQQVVARLRTQMRRTTDDPIRIDLIEDDLREGLKTVGDVQEWFDDILTLLANPDTRGRDLVDLADDSRVLDQLDYLVVVANNLRRRLLQLSVRGH